MSKRTLFCYALLGFVILFAGVLQTSWHFWWLRPVYWLARYQLFHIVMHFTIFAGAAYLYRPQDRRGWLIVLGGGLMIEIMQIGVGRSLTLPGLVDSLFDLMVDTLGALTPGLILKKDQEQPHTAAWSR